MREAIDELIGAGVAEFTPNQTLQIGVIGLEALGTGREIGVVGDQAVARRFQLGPTVAQKNEVTGAQRSADTANHQQREDGAED